MASVKVFLKNIGKEAEVEVGELKHLLNERLISAEDYIKAVRAEAEKALPGYEAKAEQDVAKAEADAKAVEAKAAEDAEALKRAAEDAVKAAEDSAKQAGQKQPAHEVKPAESNTEPPEATPDNKKDGAA